MEEKYFDDDFCGLYIIKNLKNNWFYIGESKTVLKRLRTHKRELLAKKHKNQKMQLDFDVYGLDAFEFKPFLKCDDEDIKKIKWLELKYIYEDFKDERLYNDESWKDFSCYCYARDLVDKGIKFEIRKKQDLENKKWLTFDLVYIDEWGLECVVDFKDIDTFKNDFDLKTLTKHKNYCEEKSIEFTNINKSLFFQENVQQPIKHNFNVYMDMTNFKAKEGQQEDNIWI